MARFVRDSGPLTAKLLLVGEAPGKDESRVGQPFMGNAGKLMTRWSRLANIQRTQARITNTYAYQPPGNNLERIRYSDRQAGVATLRNLIERMPNLELIVPMGAYALQALIPEIPGTITKLRGSVYKRGKHWVMPMIHPAATFHQPKFIQACMRDWERAALILDDPTIVKIPKRDLEILPSYRRVKEVKSEILSLGEHDILAMDIETPKEKIRKKIGMWKNGKPRYKKLTGPRYLSCISFSWSPDHAISVPLLKAYWKEWHYQIWEIVEEICASRVAKVFHNGMFDVFHLNRVRCRVNNWRYDTKDMHHALDCWSQHSLAFCASTDTWEPYWKDDSGTKGNAGLPFDLARYYKYNAKDSAVTLELCRQYLRRLIAVPYQNPQTVWYDIAA